VDPNLYKGGGGSYGSREKQMEAKRKGKGPGYFGRTGKKVLKDKRSKARKISQT